MKVSTKGRYGLRALVDLAVNSQDTHISLISIAERQKISINYLEQVFATLRKAGIVKSIKGAQGGYILANTPDSITVAEIIRVLEGDFAIIDENTYEEGKTDSIQYAIKTLVWDKINQNVNNYLKSKTLEDLVTEYKRLNGTLPMMFYI